VILVFNAGSSSLKYELLDDADGTLAGGQVARIGQPGADCPDHAAAVKQALGELSAARPDGLDGVLAVGHRVVHGGPALWEPTPIDEGVVAALERYAELAPLHNGPSLAAIRAARSALGNVPHVAVFDTGFHHDLPAVARTYALPAELTGRFGLRRYGFHGISCAYLVDRVAELGIAPATRTIICHLGAGSSLTAVRDGRSVDTSMGFTPLEGLAMGTRAGDVDPGLLFYLLRHAGLDADALERVLERESGMKGLGGRSGDYAELEKLAAGGDARAILALEVFAYRVGKYLGGYWAALGGVDLVVFSGGIGENAAGARARILTPLAEVGWRLDRAANAEGPAERAISPPGARPALWVIPTRETVEVARRVRLRVFP
jgi:acetate kinase